MPVVISEMRTGSTFVSEVLSQTLHGGGYNYIKECEWMPDPRSAFEQGRSQLIKMHHAHFNDIVVHADNGVGIIVTVRDPLDVYLSATHHLASTKGWTFTESLAHLESFDWVNRMAERMMSFIDNSHPNVGIVPYEKLIATPVAVLSQTLNNLGVSYNQEQLSESCRKFGFSKKTGWKLGEERLNSHERNGTVGQWRNCGIKEIRKRANLSEDYRIRL